MSQEAATGRIVFAGTGGGAHVMRGHAAYALEFGPAEALLLDTGGGFEVVRSLKVTNVDLAAIRYVFLSHRHSDHINGLEPLLLHIALYALRTDRHAAALAIIAHPVVLQAAKTLIATMASFAPHLLASRGATVTWIAAAPGVPLELRSGLTLTPFAVDHPPFDGSALGCALAFQYGGKPRRFVYSGDTRPTPALPKYAQDADILLCEAGGLDRDQEVAHEIGHSTAGEVARMATACHVGSLFLTHVPDESLVGAMRDEARRDYRGPLALPDDLDSYAFSDLFLPLVDTP